MYGNKTKIQINDRNQKSQELVLAESCVSPWKEGGVQEPIVGDPGILASSWAALVDSSAIPTLFNSIAVWLFSNLAKHLYNVCLPAEKRDISVW